MIIFLCFHSNRNEQKLRLKTKAKAQFFLFMSFLFCKFTNLYDVIFDWLDTEIWEEDS